MIRTAGKYASLIALFGAMLSRIFGCKAFNDSSSPTNPNAPLAAEVLGNYILFDAESGDWAAYYTPGDTYFKLTIPTFTEQLKFGIALFMEGHLRFFENNQTIDA